jgi:hypothetical protein
MPIIRNVGVIPNIGDQEMLQQLVMERIALLMHVTDKESDEGKELDLLVQLAQHYEKNEFD